MGKFHSTTATRAHKSKHKYAPHEQTSESESQGFKTRLTSTCSQRSLSPEVAQIEKLRPPQLVLTGQQISPLSTWR
jgi:hypothetical protein